MIKNYIKIAYKVMLRQKFFTAVSLFGISFTIMLFSIATGLFNLVFGNNAPGINHDRLIYFEGAIIRTEDKSLPQPVENIAFYSNISKLKNVDKISLYNTGLVSAFKNDKVSSFKIAFTDSIFWDIYQFKFLEGRPFTEKDIREAQSYAVITESAKKYYFGNESAIGKSLGTKYNLRVIGVVKDHQSLFSPGAESASIWVPATLSQPKSYLAIILARSKKDIPDLKDDIREDIGRRYHAKVSDVFMNAKTIFEQLQFADFMTFLGGFIFFILIIPTLNLVGLNINRISERSSEIGVRKAFGASSRVLTGQFLIENLLITFMGGILGIVFTFVASDLVIRWVNFNNQEAILASHNMLINWDVIICSLAGIFFFGLLSGIVPAWRMSKLHAVTALKGGGQ